jgi:hypothetical protein
MSTSTFEQVSSSLTVMSICGPLGPDIPAGTPLFEVERLLDPGEDPNLDPWHDPSRVIDSNGHLVGILWFDAWANADDEIDVDDVMYRPDPWQFLSSSTTILDAVQLFATTSTDVFYVIHANQVVGYLSYRSIFHPVGRLAFLALALEIEEQALRLCQHPPFRAEAWQAISDTRRCKAIELFKGRYEREPKQSADLDKLIDCTQLADKATMIWKAKLISRASSRSELLRFFEDLRRVRDFCAHPQRSSSGDDLIPNQRLSKFINGAKSMRDTLNEALLNHGVSRRHMLVLEF